ncbi:type 4 pilus major pilin [Limnohabitans sp. 2KL-17]|uniref:type 4 pilus major pilin n=1 Tax=Limnohabitans sp. 2KL-17 TaxID=1100704 RepID=UPI001304A04C|nr:type 4 pilus major pilin [Limnohabitans sp. 2KL-17]
MLKNKKNGFTLVEILLVVGFIALAGIGIYTVYSKVQNSNAALTEGKNLDTLRGGIKSLYGGTQNYAGITNTILNDGRITPDSMRPMPYQAGNGTITNSFGGPVIVTPVSLGGTNNAFRVEYNNVPGSVCAKLISGAGAGWDQIEVGTGTVQVKPFGTGSLNIGALTTSCASDTGTGIPVVFVSL